MSSWQPSASLRALQARAEGLAQIRAFFAQRGVLEVQTPVLGSQTVTDPNVESIPVPGYGFLQTSPEYFMKRLLVADCGDCYQMGPAFRHEENGRLHNTEFTLLEWYRLGFDDRQLMDEVAQLCDLVLGRASYQRLTYEDLVGGDLALPAEELDLKFMLACEALPDGRFFITDYPAEQAALARIRPEGEAVAARFELVIDRIEVANGYWELAEAAEHRRRFAQDRLQRQRQGKSLPDVDLEFLAALDHGLPDCAGVAIGVDRLMMLAYQASTIDEMLAFRG